MELLLTVIRYQNHGSEQAWAAQIGQTGGTIGRSPDNDLVLPHSGVSRLHARIDFRDGDFYLTDISTNGTFVNNAAEPLRTGQAVALHEGDTLGIGPYDVQVSFEAARLQPAESLDPFGSGEHEHVPVAETPGGTATPDILDLVSEREPPKTAGPFAEPKEIPLDNALFRPPEAIPENYDILSDTFGPQPTEGDATISDEQLLHAPSARKSAAPAGHSSDLIARKHAPPEHRVQFSVFVPARIVPGGAFVLDVWAHLAADYPHVCSWAKEVGRETIAGHRSGVNLLSGSILTVQVKLPGLTITNPVDNIFWDGEPTNASFAVAVPVDQRPGALLGKVIVQADGLTITKILFTVHVATEEGREYVERSTQRVSINSAFASYAGDDRADVLARIQGMQKVVPDLDVFVDVFSLRSGERWEQKLKEYVPTRDTFYLFWSKRASESVWVEREWRLALESRGLDYTVLI